MEVGFLSVLEQYKCPCCDGAIEFNSDAQKLKCPYCDSEFDIDSLRQTQDQPELPREDMRWDTQSPNQWREGEQEQLRSFQCTSCGGEILTEETTAATMCPYCGNPVVMLPQVTGTLKPDLVIPFQLDKEDAKAALARHLNGKILLPKVFKTENYIDKIQGVYVPFWLFDADAHGDIRFRATRVRHWSDSRYTYTKTSHYRIFRSGSLAFRAVPVDGSAKMADELMESIEPYDLSRAVDFQTAYLAGYLADKYDVQAEACQQRANDRIRTSTVDTFAGTVVGYSSVQPENSAIALKNTHVRYALLPVWLLNTTYRGEKFTFAMNGQTGKFVGNLPMDKTAFWLWWAGVTAVATALFAALAYFAF